MHPSVHSPLFASTQLRRDTTSTAESIVFILDSGRIIACKLINLEHILNFFQPSIQTVCGIC